MWLLKFITEEVLIDVLITNEMYSSYDKFLFHSFCLLYMFRRNLVVHHQEHGVIYCITQYNRYNRYNLAYNTRIYSPFQISP
jgi:phage terminase small subunit